MNLYLIIDGVTKQVIAVCDSKTNAEQIWRTIIREKV